MEDQPFCEYREDGGHTSGDGNAIAGRVEVQVAVHRQLRDGKMEVTARSTVYAGDRQSGLLQAILRFSLARILDWICGPLAAVTAIHSARRCFFPTSTH